MIARPQDGTSPKGSGGRRADRPEHWLPLVPPTRRRPSAYAQLYFGSRRGREIEAILESLERERDELGCLYSEITARRARIALLEGRLETLTPTAGRAEQPVFSVGSFPHPRERFAEPGSRGSARRSYALGRCEGFDVDSPAGPIGYVDGVRYLTRIDEPDLLEVRCGRLGRRLLIVPVEQVEEVSPAEERILLREIPDPSADLLGDLAGRVRDALFPGRRQATSDESDPSAHLISPAGVAAARARP